jgi:hypothetical protein
MIGFYAIEADNEDQAIEKIREEYRKDPMFYLDEALYDAEVINEDEELKNTGDKFVGSVIDMRKVFAQLKKDATGGD